MAEETKKRKLVDRDPYPQRNRDTKKTRRYDPGKYVPDEWEIPVGEGKALSSMKVIADHISSLSRNSEFYPKLHSLLYAKKAKKTQYKKNIGAFTGLPNVSDKEDKQNFIESKLLVQTSKFLYDVHGFLGLKEGDKSRSNLSKDDLANDIADFLAKPKPTLVVSKKFDWKESDDEPKRKTKKVTKKKEESSDSESEDEKKKKKGKGKTKPKNKKKEDSSDDEEEEKKTKTKGKGKGKKQESDSDAESSEDEKEKKKSGTKRKSKSQGGKTAKKPKIEKDALEEGQYLVEYASSNRSSCTDAKCKEKIGKDELRVGRVIKGQGDHLVTKYYHAGCLVSAMSRMRGKTSKPESTDDFIGYDDLKEKDKKKVAKIFKD